VCRFLRARMARPARMHQEPGVRTPHLALPLSGASLRADPRERRLASLRSRRHASAHRATHVGPNINFTQSSLYRGACPPPETLPNGRPGGPIRRAGFSIAVSLGAPARRYRRILPSEGPVPGDAGVKTTGRPHDMAIKLLRPATGVTRRWPGSGAERPLGRSCCDALCPRGLHRPPVARGSTRGRFGMGMAHADQAWRSPRRTSAG
jgi:hypothetical protein